MDVDVVIPAYGEASRLNHLLVRLNEEAAVVDQRLRVVISDDGSPQPVADTLDSSPLTNLDVLVVRGPNGGPGAARNRGIARCNSSWVAFLDADTVPAKGWLSRLRLLLSDAQDADGLEGTVDVPSGGATPFTHATEIRNHVAHGGANIVYRRDALERINGFSEDFYDPRRHMHFREDSDFYFRAVDAGLRVVPAPGLQALHPPLDSSIWTPIRLSRRYYFDVLLDKRHHARFAELNATRSVGVLTLRGARHWVSVAHVALATLASIEAVGQRRTRRLAWLCGAVAASWGGSVASLGWGKNVTPRSAPAVLLVSMITPFVYVWHFYRGVLQYRHHPWIK